jgi:uncharacterized protein
MGGILDQYVVPFLRRDEYGEGLLNGMAAVAQVVAQNAGVRLNLGRYAPGAGIQPKARGVIGLLPFFFFVLFVILGLLGRRRGMFPFFFLPLIFMGGFGGGMSGGGGASRGF